MLRYNYNNIIIIIIIIIFIITIIIIATNVIMLKFLPFRFIHPVAQLPLYLFLNTSLNVRTTKANKLFNKLFYFTTMTSELSKNLNEQQGVFWNMKYQ